MKNKHWDNPVKRSVGLFTDLRLFADALDIARFYDVFSKKQLREGLSKRVKGLIFIKELSLRVINHLVRELVDFGWIGQFGNGSHSHYRLTENGSKVIELLKNGKQKYFELLILKMHEIYTVPGWFVNRLWDLNPDGQGEIVIPAPMKSWNPKSKPWEDKEWNRELSEQVRNSFRSVSKICEGAFPVSEETWIDNVRMSWDRLSNLKRRNIKEKGLIKTYAPRRRLFNAMKEAAVHLLFGNVNFISKAAEFQISKRILPTRNYMVWCPRLSELGLIFYTDSHPRIPGRLIFPVSVFKGGEQTSSFNRIEGIRNPTGDSLFIHQPGWQELNSFSDVLFGEHQRAFSSIKSLYVSILDVRDEVCRLLRISAHYFDKFLEKAIDESSNNNFKYSISIESDIREDQGRGYQKLRRPVFVSGKPYSLIAMTKLKNNRKEDPHE